MSLRVDAADQEKQVLAYVRGAGLNLTENRRTILAVFWAGTQPVTITDLWLRAKKADPRTSYGTVWRLLNALVERGLAHREIAPADGILRYGPVEIECSHEHIACKDCGANISPEGGQHDPVEHVGKE
jgi:Fur family ferric uptake transcriptional regulator